MQSDQAPLLDWLVLHQLIESDEIVNGHVMLCADANRHLNTAVLRKAGADLFVKQAQDWQPMSLETLQVEASWYERLSKLPPQLKPEIPAFHHYDPPTGRLVIGFRSAALNLAVLHRDYAGLDSKVSAATGRQLARLHDSIDAGDDQLPSASVPWIITFADSGAPGDHFSPANQRLQAEIQQRPVLASALVAMQHAWEPTCAVHMDMKWENCIVEPNSTNVCLIDWETAGLGDAAWDVGSMIQAWMLQWCLDETARPGADSITGMRQDLQAFWSAYINDRARNLNESRDALLLRSIKYAGARLIQSSFEMLVFDNAPKPEAATALQLAENTLLHPESVRDKLLQLDVGGVA